MKTLLERIADMAACVGGNVGEVLLDAAKEINALRAKIEQMERQEPYAFAVNFPESSRVELVHDLDEAYEDMTYEACEVRKLYLAPGAQPEPSVRITALYPVISWLRNGCDPMKAAVELEMLAAAPEAKP